jgi:hypothetical protein
MPSIEELSQYNTFLPLLLKIFIGIFIVYVIILGGVSIFNVRKSSPVLISKPDSTMNQKVISAINLPLSNTNEGLSWTLIHWLYVEDWNYRFGQKKMIVNWGNNLQMYFDDQNNDLVLEVKTFPLGKVNKLVQKNIPLQKWICLIAVLDGQLVQNMQLEYMPSYSQEEITLFEQGGFRGKSGYFQYLSYRIPQFGINHFQQLGNKLNNTSILYKFYNTYMFATLFSFKTLFQNVIVVFDRNFKRVNTTVLDILKSIFRILRNILAFIIDMVNRIIFR